MGASLLAVAKSIYYDLIISLLFEELPLLFHIIKLPVFRTDITFNKVH